MSDEAENADKNEVKENDAKDMEGGQEQEAEDPSKMDVEDLAGKIITLLRS